MKKEEAVRNTSEVYGTAGICRNTDISQFPAGRIRVCLLFLKSRSILYPFEKRFEPELIGKRTLLTIRTHVMYIPVASHYGDFFISIPAAPVYFSRSIRSVPLFPDPVSQAHP